ncbi:interferon phi 2 [Plectropomus leopardus]|uniref:interferon phi 2 n=1 Tax=Plectropomus leopardus TaxID=160734 RepID=UPI001C4DD273|nr:interferon phi 2 [Plectropomus leopardus]
MSVSSVLLVLLQVCSLHLMAVAKPTCRLEGDLIQNAHNLLRDLGGPFPVHCLSLNANVSFPRSLLPAPPANQPQCHQASWVVYESLQEAENIFDELPVPEGGATKDAENFTKFQHLQSRLVEQGTCLSAGNGSDVLSSYFSKLTAALQQQDSAACGWKALWRDLQWVLKSALQKPYRTCFTWRDPEETQ